MVMFYVWIFIALCNPDITNLSCSRSFSLLKFEHGQFSTAEVFLTSFYFIFFFYKYQHRRKLACHPGHHFDKEAIRDVRFSSLSTYFLLFIGRSNRTN